MTVTWRPYPWPSVTSPVLCSLGAKIRLNFNSPLCFLNSLISLVTLHQLSLSITGLPPKPFLSWFLEVFLSLGTSATMVCAISSLDYYHCTLSLKVQTYISVLFVCFFIRHFYLNVLCPFWDTLCSRLTLNSWRSACFILSGSGLQVAAISFLFVCLFGEGFTV